MIVIISSLSAKMETKHKKSCLWESSLMHFSKRFWFLESKKAVKKLPLCSKKGKGQCDGNIVLISSSLGFTSQMITL